MIMIYYGNRYGGGGVSEALEGRANDDPDPEGLRSNPIDDLLSRKS